LAALKATGAIKALAHITGGGFTDNIPRALPKGMTARIELAKVRVPPVFRWLASAGRIAEAEMLRTFNCGTGMIVIAGHNEAKAKSIATVTIDHTAYKSREGFEFELAKHLAGANIDIICLAGFMRVLTAEFVKQWDGRMLNVHPSLLPAFKGIDTHVRVLDAGAKVHGCTVH